MLYPMVFSPILKERIWGGKKLQERYGRELPGDKIGESWDVACHENGTSVVANGPLKGKTLKELISEYGPQLLGRSFSGDETEKFPLLIKILDASDVLSVQVHPSDDYAAVHEKGELGKSEMWYIIAAEPGAKLVYGVKSGTTKEEFSQALQEGALERHLYELPVEAGDVVFIPSGMVHAIGAGILICEIQQNSDTTYRVYDWNRIGDDGKPRELHVSKALDVIDFAGRYSRKKIQGLILEGPTYTRTIYVACEYFAMEKIVIKGVYFDTADGEKFFTLTVIEGDGRIRYTEGEVSFKAGDSLMIPANLGEYEIEGTCVVIKAYVPDKERDIIQPLREKGFNKMDLTQIAGLFE